LKHHLVGAQMDVGACKDVTEGVKKEMSEIVVGLQICWSNVDGKEEKTNLNLEVLVSK